MKYIIEKYTVPLIWAKKLEAYTAKEELLFSNTKTSIGPFLTLSEASRMFESISTSSIFNVLNGKLDDIKGWNFYYEGQKEITLKIPNVAHAKKQNLLKSTSDYTSRDVMDNMTICGFDVLSIDEGVGVFTKVTTECCNVDCKNKITKPYAHYITWETIPYCNTCKVIVQSMNYKKHRKIIAINHSTQILFNSRKEAAEEMKLPRQTIYNYLKSGKTHSSGYRFEYCD